MKKLASVIFTILTGFFSIGCTPDPPTPPPLPTKNSAIPVPVACPFYVYEDRGSANYHFVPEGFMGDTAAVTLDENYRLDPERPDVIRITYTPTGSEGVPKWAGIYWWDPAGSDWGTKYGGFNISCATKLTFWARGEAGGEIAEFKVGGLDGVVYDDSLLPAATTGPITLTNTWHQYTLDLSGKNLSHIIGGFVWATPELSEPQSATIYLDDIRYEQ